MILYWFNQFYILILSNLYWFKRFYNNWDSIKSILIFKRLFVYVVLCFLDCLFLIYVLYDSNKTKIIYLYSRVDETTFNSQEQEKFGQLCRAFADELVPFLNRCLQALFPPAHLALILGVPVAELSKIVRIKHLYFSSTLFTPHIAFLASNARNVRGSGVLNYPHWFCQKYRANLNKIQRIQNTLARVITVLVHILPLHLF